MSNTFGGRHHYWLRPDPASRTFRAAAHEVALRVAVHAGRPGVRVRLHAAGRQPRGAHGDPSERARSGFDATLSLERRPWNAAEIRRALMRHPAMTAQVMADIHWQALKLWWKGVPRRARVSRADGVGERAAQAAETAGRTDSCDGAMSMVTQWAKTAFLSGLGGVTGGTLTVECPDRDVPVRGRLASWMRR